MSFRIIIFPRRCQRRQLILKFHRPHASFRGRNRPTNSISLQAMQKAPHGLHAPSITLLRFLRHQLQAPLSQGPAVRRPRLSRTQCRTFTITLATSATRPSHLVHLPFAKSPSPTPTCFAANLNRPLFPPRHFAATTSLQESFWRRLRRSRGDKPCVKHLKHGDLPPLAGFLDDNAGLGGRIIKPSNELKLRCTEFDENGNVTLVNGEFKKSELTQKVRSSLEISLRPMAMTRVLTGNAFTVFSPSPRPPKD